MAKSAQRPGFSQRAPLSVKLAVGLLCLQATIWALLSAGLAYADANDATAHPGKVTTTGFVITALIALAAGTFAATKFRLAYGLPRGTHRTRETVIMVEVVMAGFAGLILLALFITLYGVILSPPVIIGGLMSVLVAHGLAKPPARQYFDANEAAGTHTPNLRSPDGGSPALFRARLAAA